MSEKALTEFTKYDNDKPMYDLLVPEFLDETAQVLTLGAKKYSPDNWSRCDGFRRYFAAMMRHLWAFWRGEDNDRETGKSHLAHAACCLMFLFWIHKHKPETDDRMKSAQ